MARDARMVLVVLLDSDTEDIELLEDAVSMLPLCIEAACVSLCHNDLVGWNKGRSIQTKPSNEQMIIKSRGYSIRIPGSSEMFLLPCTPE